jgi:hypothetical protein
MSDTASVLSPIDRFSEMLFGLIMVLTITGSLSAATAGRQEIATVLGAAIGCNIAWGIVDAVMFLMTRKLELGHNRLFVDQIRTARDVDQAREVLRDAMPPSLSDSLDGEQVDDILGRIRSLPEPTGARLTTADGRGALAVFLLVVAATLPVTVPFLLFSDFGFAMLISRVTGLILLFAGGWALGRYAGFSQPLTALTMLGLGVLLVGTTLAPGG